VVQNTSHSVQIITGGKVQTLQVLGAPKSPIMSPQNKPAGNLVISQCQQPLPRSDSPTANVSTRPASACEGTWRTWGRLVRWGRAPRDRSQIFVFRISRKLLSRNWL